MSLTKLPAELGKVGADEAAAGDLHEMSDVNRWLAEPGFTVLLMPREQQHFFRSRFCPRLPSMEFQLKVNHSAGWRCQ